ncbi:YktB family protein [Litchfieldia salsa]|uniref:UPF0637 protein SAMN05216565_102237 n=1 Tax=Litchfieldia salsa TaxID=930152 RepID=A0A1H0RJ28_9BACI|nr:DUF1054 domain-containing protein [Litchfieldia salsa]SDP29451.1 Uncharacterized protein YktB, UPF0637 family [Litchfieldia salsa]
MDFNGFKEADFKVFQIDGLEPRMEALKSTIRPKLEALGFHFAPTLSTLVGDELFHHVAKHARRTINPPKDTWVAFANSKRGYKQLPHFQIGLWETHVFIWFAMIYEAPNKKEFGQKLKQKVEEIQDIIPTHFVWSDDHTKPEAKSLDQEGLVTLFDRVINVKKAEVLCGLNIPKAEAIDMGEKEWINLIDDTFKKLIPLYEIAKLNSNK